MEHNNKRRSLEPIYENLFRKWCKAERLIFDEIEGGKYNKEEIHTFQLKALSIRFYQAIRPICSRL